MKIVALGRTNWLYDSIVACANAGHKIVAIGTGPASPEYSVKESDFARLAATLGSKFFSVTKSRHEEIEQNLSSSTADVAISVNWMKLLQRETIQLFPNGIINAHAGDLPRFRGNAVANWAILSGEPRVVLTLHLMSPELDQGPVLLKRAMDLTEATYIGDIYAFLNRAIPEMYVDVLQRMTDGNLVPQAQSTDPADALRCLPRIPDDGLIDWKESSQQIHRLVRASAEPFTGAFTYLGQKKLVIWRSHREPCGTPLLGIPGQVVERRSASGEVTVLTGEGLLVLESVQLEGEKTRRAAAECILSTRTRLRTPFFKMST